MSYNRMNRGQGHGTSGSGHAREEGVPGRRTLTESLPSVAARGLATAGAKDDESDRKAVGWEPIEPEAAEQPEAEEAQEADEAEGAEDTGGDEAQAAPMPARGPAGESGRDHGPPKTAGAQAAASSRPARESTIDRKVAGGTGQSYATIRNALPDGFPDVVGLTRNESDAPQFQTATWESASGDQAKVKINSVTAPALRFPTYIAAPVGTHDVGGIKYKVTKAINKQIKRAEKEHHDDYQRAYKLTFKAAHGALKKLKGKWFAGATLVEAQEKLDTALAGKLHARLTANPDTWATVIQELNDLSPAARDGGNHSWDYDEAEVSGETVRTFRSNPHVPGPPSSTVINL